jgi:hypothetical protein
MQNVMLDLAGGVTRPGNQPNPGNGSILVGPHADAQVWVNPAYIGIVRDGQNVYFIPAAKDFVKQDQPDQQYTNVPAHTQIPSLVDAFGTPLLAWVQNDMAMGPIANENNFADVSSQSNAGARFYWNSNAAFLRAKATGIRSINQTGMLEGGGHDVSRGSILAFPNDDNRRKSLIGMLGHPSFPQRNQGVTTPPSLPAAARGTFIVHSAGGDGYYFNRQDRGARQFPLYDASGSIVTNSFFLDYRVNFVPNVANPAVGYTDRDGRPTNVDILERFDDILAVGGN